MTIRELQAKGTALLKAPCASACIDTPALDAALLLAETLQVRREDLIAHANDEAAERDYKKYRALLERRRAGECIAYILGRKEFRGLEFAVKAQVLVPRPDTETLFEAALEYIDSAAGNDGLSVLDLCAGSGALAVSLKKERPLLLVTASDISAEALETAALNAGRLLTTGEAAESAINIPRRRAAGYVVLKRYWTRVSYLMTAPEAAPVSRAQRAVGMKPSPRISFVQSDIFENLQGQFDIIVSNPPYIPSGEISNLAPEVQLEPRLALDGGEDGLALIRRIIADAPPHLPPGGVLLLEADPGQMPQIGELLANNGFTGVRLHKDLAGRERVISARLH
jgi:release factor glutamine methyltransferase